MKRLLISGLFLVILGAAALSMAETAKIGYVDLQQALNISDAGKEAREVFKSEVDRIQKELDIRQEELRKMKDELEKQAFLLSDETRDKKEKEYQERLKKFQRFYQDSQEELQQKDAQLTKKIFFELRDVIAKLGQEEGYTLILEKIESNILYAPKAIDLTAEVVRKYNDSKKQP